MVFYLFGFAFVAYMQRTSFSVAGAQIMPELGLTQIQWGWLLTAFLIAYTAFQLPGGLFGEWLGAREALAVIAGVGLCAAIATPLAPSIFPATVVFAGLILAQLLLGLSQAPPLNDDRIKKAKPRNVLPIVAGSLSSSPLVPEVCGS